MRGELDILYKEIGRWRAEASKWQSLHDELADVIMFEVNRDSYGPTETDAECIKRIIRERNEIVEALEGMLKYASDIGADDFHVLITAALKRAKGE